jgi:hypothetical protein
MEPGATPDVRGHRPIAPEPTRDRNRGDPRRWFWSGELRCCPRLPSRRAGRLTVRELRRQAKPDSSSDSNAIGHEGTWAAVSGCPFQVGELPRWWPVELIRMRPQVQVLVRPPTSKATCSDRKWPLCCRTAEECRISPEAAPFEPSAPAPSPSPGAPGVEPPDEASRWLAGRPAPRPPGGTVPAVDGARPVPP